jgi:hypothetical protein
MRKRWKGDVVDVKFLGHAMMRVVDVPCGFKILRGGFIKFGGARLSLGHPLFLPPPALSDIHLSTHSLITLPITTL